MATVTYTSGDGRSALLSAALDELQEHGASNLSLRAIARRAGVSHAAPKHHFHDRAGLLTAVATSGFRRLHHALAEAVGSAGDDPARQFTAGARAYVTFGLRNPQLFSLMFRADELDASSPELRLRKKAAYDVLRHGIAAGAAPRENVTTENLSLIALSFMHGLVVLIRDGALNLRSETDIDELVTTLTETFTDMIRTLQKGTP